MFEKETKILERQTVNRYSEIAEAYSSDWRGRNDETQLAYIRDFEDLVGSPPKRILDAGCGTGKDSLEFSANGYEVVSLDLSEGMLNKAVENAKSTGAEINPVICNMRTLGLETQSVDGVWNMASLVHLPALAKRDAIQEFHRALKPKGVLHIGIQNLLSSKHIVRLIQSYLCELGYDDQNQFYIKPKTLNQIVSDIPFLDRLKTGYAYLDDRHWFFPTKFAISKMLEEEGFSIIKSDQAFVRHLNIVAQKQ